jgi:hypothetical protein
MKIAAAIGLLVRNSLFVQRRHYAIGAGHENEVRATAYPSADLLICPTGKSVSLLIFCLASFAKIFRFPRRANHLYTLAPSRLTQGRLAIVTDAGRDAVDAGALSDERRATRTAKSCGPDASTLASRRWR